MAIAVQLDFVGTTIDTYDQINERLGALPGGPTWRQELFHWVTQTSDGFRVVDVWETREAFERFAQEKLGPVYQEVGVANAPEVRFFEIHNYLAAGRR